jgi:hypothetical protein
MRQDPSPTMMKLGFPGACPAPGLLTALVERLQSSYGLGKVGSAGLRATIEETFSYAVYPRKP